MYCCYCGAKLNDDAKFCSACGKPVGNAAQPANVAVEEEKPQKKLRERKPKQPQPPKEQKPEGESALDKKLFGKLPVKTLLGAVGTLVVVILAIVLIVSAVREHKRNTVVGEIPNPEVFFGMSGDHDYYETFWNEHDIHFRGGEVTKEMVLAYVDVLSSDKYPFVLSDTISFNDGMTRYVFVYNGPEEIYDVYSRQIMVEFAPYLKTPRTTVEIYNSGNFELVSAERYTAGGIVVPEPDSSAGQGGSTLTGPSVSEDIWIPDSGDANAAVSQAPTQSTQSKPGKPREPELVVSEIAVENKIDAPDNAVPELGAWSNGAAEADRLVDNESPYMKYDVSYEVMKEYLQALQANGFTLVDTYENSYKGDTYLSWGFTCDAMPGAKTIEMQYDDTPCHVTIWMDDDYDEYTIEISPSLRYYDTGLRRGGSTVNEVISGPSAGAGLLRLADGSYQTTDGRLTAALGNATVIRDGKTYTCDARWMVEKEDERLWVEDYYRSEGIFFEVPKSSLMEGDVLLASDLMRERYYVTEKSGLESYNWHTPMFAIAYNGKWRGPQLNDSDFEAVTVRVMYYQPGGEAVYYIYAKMPYAEPSEVEALVAVSLANSSGGSFSDATRLKVGDTVTVNYSGQEWMPNYEVYEWEITDGAGNVSIDDNVDSCEVTAKGKGVATVKVTYNYGTEEPDVLTGIMRRVGKSKSQTYNFIIE